VTALLIAAGSGIARPLALALAAEGHDLIITTRDAAEGERIAEDLRLRSGRAVRALVLDVADMATHAAVVAEAVAVAAGLAGGKMDVVACCAGTMADNDEVRTDHAVLARMMLVNCTGVAHVLERCADALVAQGGGVIAALSSVAGDRGRQSNYGYGAAKAGLTAYLSGLRNRCQPLGVHVVTIKPGFVATPMTAGLLDPKSPLVASPERVARGIVWAIRRRKNVVYLPWFWWGIMTIICAIPEWLFKRLKL